MDVVTLLSNLVEVEYINIRLELYIKPSDDINSKLQSGLIPMNNLSFAYKEKIKGLWHYLDAIDNLSKYFSKDVIMNLHIFIDKNIKCIDSILSGMDKKIDTESLAKIINIDFNMYLKLVHNNNIIMTNLSKMYLNSAEPDTSAILVMDTILSESNDNYDLLKVMYEKMKSTYPKNNNVDLSKLCLFQISEIEKAINEIEGINRKSRKNINELYQYYNEILKLKKCISQV